MEITKVPLGLGDWRRDYSKSAAIPVINRFYETSPVISEGDSALLSRPGLKRWLSVGTGPFRGMYCQRGVFNDALFVVSGTGLYRINTDETVSLIGTSLAGNPNGFVSMVATDAHLFIADGTNLYYYTDDSYAKGTLTASGAISTGEQVRIGSVYYQFTSGSVDTGSPQGTAANPWLVALGGSTATALENLSAAILANGTSGTTYSTSLTKHSEVGVNSNSATTLVVQALDAGVDGNTIPTTETGVNLAWGAATLANGGTTAFSSITMPDGVGAIWVEVLASHVFVIPAQIDEKKGRFYWIEPAQITVDPLNFATAERAPDELYSCITLGDRIWFFGSGTLETWYATGDGISPFQRVQGMAFDHGAWEGTPVRIKDKIIAVDRDGSVWKISNQGVKKVSDHGVEQRVREAIKAQLA